MNLIFQSWLKDIKAHVEDWNLTEWEAIQLVKDFPTTCTNNKVDFNMGMVVEDQQTSVGIINHLISAFHLAETISELMSDFYSYAQRKNETEDVFTDDLKILVRKIIACKTSFRAEANKQLRHQYFHKLHDQYYAAIAHSVNNWKFSTC